MKNVAGTGGQLMAVVRGVPVTIVGMVVAIANASATRVLKVGSGVETEG